MELLPEFQTDENLKMLREMFNARFISQENETHYIGVWPPSVRVGKDEYLAVGKMTLNSVCDKAELEMARSQMFAGWLLNAPREEAVKAWEGAVEWEPEYFIKALRQDIEELKKRKGL